MRRRIFFILLLLGVGVGSLSAQRKVVKEANTLLKANKFSAAETTLNPALTNEETKDLPATWNLAGQIQKKILDNENQKAYLRKPYDTLLLYNSTLKMVQDFLKCDDLSQIPDSKGKVKNKFRNANASIIMNERGNLINGGIQYYNMATRNESYNQKAVEFFGTYVDSSVHPILESRNLLVTDTLIPQIAYYACIAALRYNDYKNVLKYSVYAERGEEYAQTAAELKSTAFLQQGDSARWLASLKEGIEKYPQDRFFFANLVEYYIQSNKYEEAQSFADEILAKDPNNSFNLYVQGFLYQNQQKYDDAISTYQKAIEADQTNAEAYSSLGFTYCLKAQDFSEEATTDIYNPNYTRDQQILREYYTQAKDAYEKARELKPEQKDLWLNGLYRVYYNLQMGQQFEEIERLMQ